MALEIIDDDCNPRQRKQCVQKAADHSIIEVMKKQGSVYEIKTRWKKGHVFDIGLDELNLGKSGRGLPGESQMLEAEVHSNHSTADLPSTRPMDRSNRKVRPPGRHIKQRELAEGKSGHQLAYRNQTGAMPAQVSIDAAEITEALSNFLGGSGIGVKKLLLTHTVGSE